MTEKDLGAKNAPKVPEWPSYGNFCKVTQTRIFWKSAKRGPTEIFKKSRKTLTSIKRPKSNLAQMALSSHSYLIKVRGLKKILPQKVAPKVPEWPSYGNFRKVTQNPHFLKKCKGGTKGNFLKIAQKVNLD